MHSTACVIASGFDVSETEATRILVRHGIAELSDPSDD